MTREEIFEELTKLKISKDKYIVIDEASLVCQNVIDKTNTIALACQKDTYDKLDWKVKLEMGVEIKYNNVFTIRTLLYNPLKKVEINTYNFMDLETCYERMKTFSKDKKVLNKLELAICDDDNYFFERKLREKGINFTAGIDEVGRGPLVGPVVAACVVLDSDFSLDGLTDSKKLSEKKREMFYDLIMEQALGVGIGVVSEKVIDEINIYEATKVAMKEAFRNCHCKIDHVLIDAMKLDLNVPTTSIIKGDLKSITISAASVIAKVTRDRMLDELDQKYPMYDFKNNKGYPTKKHLEAIKEYGIIEEHRRTYEPVREYLENSKSDALKQETYNY